MCDVSVKYTEAFSKKNELSEIAKVHEPIKKICAAVVESERVTVYSKAFELSVIFALGLHLPLLFDCLLVLVHILHLLQLRMNARSSRRGRDLEQRPPHSNSSRRGGGGDGRGRGVERNEGELQDGEPFVSRECQRPRSNLSRSDQPQVGRSPSAICRTENPPENNANVHRQLIHPDPPTKMMMMRRMRMICGSNAKNANMNVDTKLGAKGTLNHPGGGANVFK
jgi:hypothetical protein